MGSSTSLQIWVSFCDYVSAFTVNPGADSQMKRAGMLIGNLELNPKGD